MKTNHLNKFSTNWKIYKLISVEFGDILDMGHVFFVVVEIGHHLLLNFFQNQFGVVFLDLSFWFWVVWFYMNPGRVNFVKNLNFYWWNFFTFSTWTEIFWWLDPPIGSRRERRVLQLLVWVYLEETPRGRSCLANTPKCWISWNLDRPILEECRTFFQFCVSATLPKTWKCKIAPQDLWLLRNSVCKNHSIRQSCIDKKLFLIKNVIQLSFFV